MRAASTPSPRTYSSRSSSASRLVGAGALGLDRGYSAHSMRATFITTALENGAQLEDVQKAAGHRDPSTTKLYDRRGYNPEKAASFFATY
jgi:integrase/recombinase XerD